MLKMFIFEGVREKHHMFRGKKATLYFTVEHHATRSLGAYEVVSRGKSAYFTSLPEAIDYFNEQEGTT